MGSVSSQVFLMCFRFGELLSITLWGPWTSSINTLKRIRNADSQALPLTC